jgi:hypothetical protein
MFAEDFAERIRPLNTGAVPSYVEIVWKRRASGRPHPQATGGCP